MKKSNLISLVGSLSFGMLLVGCGSGSGTSTSDSETPTYTLSGTVPGTLIELFCKDGSYLSVNSVDDNTSNHPFSIGVPIGISCKLVMTTNENDVDKAKRIVTPIILDDGTTSSTYLELSGDANIGYVNLSLTGEGVQEPLILGIVDSKIKINSFLNDPLDDDNDGIPNVYEDDDNDGLSNIYDDDDDDGDGIEDSIDRDHSNDDDGDGIKNDSDEDIDNDGISNDNYDGVYGAVQNITLPTLYKANDGRLLGSQCAQCHGTNGISVTSWDSIAGEDDLLDEIFDDDPLMNAQAHGYTQEEIVIIGNWLRTL